MPGRLMSFEFKRVLCENLALIPSYGREDLLCRFAAHHCCRYEYFRNALLLRSWLAEH